MDNFCEVRGQALKRRGNPAGKSPEPCRDPKFFTAVVSSVLLFIGFCNWVDFCFRLGCRVFDQLLILHTMDVDGDISCDDTRELSEVSGDDGTHLRRLRQSSLGP